MIKSEVNAGPLLKRLVIALLITLLFTLSFMPDMVQRADADEPEKKTVLYFGQVNGQWDIYTYLDGDTLSIPYTVDKNITWFVEPGKLTLDNFVYQADTDASFALVLNENCTLELNGSNSLSLTKSSADAIGLRIQGTDTTILGPGSLSITASTSTNRATGIELTKANSILTISGATLSAQTGDRAGLSYGLEASSGSQIKLENAANVSLISSRSNNTDSYGAIFRSTTSSPLSIEGEGSSFYAKGGTTAIQAGTTAPLLEDLYGVYAINGYNGGGNAGTGNWDTSGRYFEREGTNARIVHIAEKPRILTSELTYGVINKPYSITLQAQHNEAAENKMWTSNGATGSCSGFTIDRITGTLSGTPTQLGPGSITIYCSDNFGYAQHTYDFMVYSRSELRADPTENSIRGLSNIKGSGTNADPFLVEVNTDFSIEAIGDGQGRAELVPGDTEFQAIDWNMNPSGNFGGSAPFIINTRLSVAKTYTLTVNFQERKWDGNAWNFTGVTSSKTASVKAVAQPISPDNTGKGSSSGLAGTRDDSLVLPILLVLFISASVASFVGLRKRNHR